MCFICEQLHAGIISDYDAEFLYHEHRISIGSGHADNCLKTLRNAAKTIEDEDYYFRGGLW